MIIDMLKEKDWYEMNRSNRMSRKTNCTPGVRLFANTSDELV